MTPDTPRTRLEAFCESLTREMLDAFFKAGVAYDESGMAAARLVAERRVREFIARDLGLGEEYARLTLEPAR